MNFKKEIIDKKTKLKYVDEEYSILDLGIYINKKYDSILFSKIPDSFIRTLIKKYFLWFNYEIQLFIFLNNF